MIINIEIVSRAKRFLIDNYSYVILTADARMRDLEGRFQRLFEVINGEPTIPSRLQTLERSVQDLRVI